jgi:hypothetical protein
LTSASGASRPGSDFLETPRVFPGRQSRAGGARPADPEGTVMGGGEGVARPAAEGEDTGPSPPRRPRVAGACPLMVMSGSDRRNECIGKVSQARGAGLPVDPRRRRWIGVSRAPFARLSSDLPAVPLFLLRT